MITEIVNDADGGPLFKLIPENDSDNQFLSQFTVGLEVALRAVRVTMEGHGQWLNVRNNKG